MQKRKIDLIFLFILIMVIGFMLYANSLQGEFVWDDFAFIKNNSYIKDFAHIDNIFKGEIENSDQIVFYVYRPLQVLTYLIDFQLWGLNVLGYHLNNTLLHILVVFLIYQLTGVIYNNKLFFLFSSLLFLVHPVHTGAVAYISGRGDILSALFVLVSFMFYFKLLKKKKISLLVGVLLTYILAVLSKENALIFPVLILFYHYAFGKKVKWKFFLPILIINLGYVLLRAARLKSLCYDSALIFTKVPGFFAAILNYFRILFFPADLHMEYGNQLFNIADPKVISGLFVIIILVIFGFVLRKKHPLVSFSIGWFFISLLPTTGIYPASLFYMAEHWLYLPSIGFFMFISYSLTQAYQSPKKRWLVVSLVGIVLISCSFLTINQNKYWSKEISLYKRTLRFTPSSAMAHNNLGNAYLKIGDNQEAIKEYQKAVSLNPEGALAYLNLGLAYSKSADIQKAYENYLKAIKLKPDYTRAYAAMCYACVISNKNDEALKYCVKAGQLDPKNEEIFYNLGEAYYRLGEKDEAIKEYKKAIAVNPEYLEANNNLASVYSETGKVDEAISLWNKITALSPDFSIAHFNLALFYFQKKEYDLAIEHCDKVIELGNTVDPNFLKELEKYRK